MSIDSRTLEKLLHDLRVKIKSDINISSSEQEERITSKINENIDQKFEFVNKQIEKINQTNEDQEKRISLLEKQARERNIIFFGIEESEKSYTELEDIVVNTIRKMGIECQSNEIQIVKRMGKPSKDKVRPIILTLTNYGKKITILKNKKKLEQTKIYIKEDFAPKVLEIRKSLQEQLQKARNDGKMAYIKYDKIVIREPTRKKEHVGSYSSNSKKRELDITPPSESGTSTSANNSDGLVKYQTNKKNRVSARGNQGSITTYMNKKKELEGSQGSMPTSTKNRNELYSPKPSTSDAPDDSIIVE